MFRENWNVKPSGYNNYAMTRDVTWADIKTCVDKLSINCEKWGGDGEEFAALHRVEGGFMCVAGPGFQTNESVDKKLASQPCKAHGDAIVRKAIRFSSFEMYLNWPSLDHSFLGNPNLQDDTVVLPITVNVFSLEFEGQNCEPWTKHQCREYADIIYDTLQALPIHGNLAAKMANRSIAGISKRNPMRRGKKKREHTELDDGLTREMFKKIELWPTSAATGRVQAVVGYGPTGIGKTNWALAQFERPLRITELDVLKDMPPDTDGIVFDDMLFDKCAKLQMKSLTDFDQPRNVRLRASTVQIPAGVKKIFLCSEHESVFGSNPATGGHESVQDRICIMHLTKDLVRA